MATLTINTKKIIENIEKLSEYLLKENIKWTLVTKVLSGYKPALEKILSSKSINKLHSIADSRLSNIKSIKEIKPEVITMYIKPPPLYLVQKVVAYADISLNTSYETIEAINKEAKKQNKIHKIIVMVEMGELREGVVRENIISFYEKVFNLSNIKVIGLGSNLGCMYGIEPTYDKLIQLSLYKNLIEAKFNQSLELVSAGSSITLPLISKNKVPKGVNHFRIGETAFLGTEPLNNKCFKNLSTSAFDFSAEIVELEKKGMVPDGIIVEGAIGESAEIIEKNIGKESYRSIVDFGEIDVNYKNLILKDKDINFIGTTSDMTVYDTGEDKSSKYTVGDQIHFRPNYMAVARLANSKYMKKKVI
ncbi:MAG: alanine racemase [Ignavibacteriaceae bacterium]